MTLRCLFHVSTMPSATQAKPVRARMPSVIDVEVEVEAPKPRGRSHETWARARGWSSED